MKKLLLFSLAVLTFCACESIGIGEKDVNNPLNDCVISAAVQSGNEAVVQWNGFVGTPQLVLKSADGSECQVAVKVVTASGVIFVVPAGLVPGEYTLVQKGTQPVELGKIEILQPDLPVTGLKYPTYTHPGAVFDVQGIGFDESFALVLKSAQSTIRLDAQLTDAGLSVSVSDDIQPHVYSLVLVSGIDEWVLSGSFNVTRKKRLVAVRKTAPHDTQTSVNEYRVEYSGGQVVAIRYTSGLYEDDVLVETSADDRYVQEEPGFFNGIRVENGENLYPGSYNFQWRYFYDESGRIVSTDVLRFSNKEPAGIHREFKWEYDTDGRPSKVPFELGGMMLSHQTYQYDNGNLVSLSFVDFAYDDETLVNNPYAVDAALGYDMMRIYEEPFLYVPYITGVHSYVSRLLPSGYYKATGLSSVGLFPFTYEFDQDGYMTVMSWEGSASISFIYE